MAAPAPLPLSVQQQETASNGSISVPVAPKISDKLLNLDKTDRYFVNVKQKSHGKQWIAKCLEKAGLIEIESGFLPHPNCIFFWIQREYAFFDYEILSGKENKPCIAFIPSQNILCEKTKFAKILYKYYGNDAWKITPMTMDCDYDDENEKWIVSENIKKLIESFESNHVWITKTNFGSLGSGIFLYRGNTIKSFENFINTKYKPTNWGKRLKEIGWHNTENINLKSIIVQQYIDKPLLYNNYYKFDLRVYSLIATTNPCILFYHIGKQRICGIKYEDLSKINDDEMKEMMLSSSSTSSRSSRDELSNVLYGHLSNCKIQRSHNDYDYNSSSIAGQTMLNDWNQFIQFIYKCAVNKKMFKKDWFEKYQYKYNDDWMNKITLKDIANLIDLKISRLLSQLFSASKSVLDQDSIKYKRPCQFVFNGDDIIIDENGKFILLEVNRCPSLSLCGHNTIKEMTKNMLKEAIDICLEIRELKIKKKNVDQNTPLKSPHFWLKCKLDYKLSITQRIDKIINDLDVLLNK